MTENMVGHKLGEFAPTRHFKGHTTKAERRRRCAGARRGGGAGRRRWRSMVEAHATARYIRDVGPEGGPGARPDSRQGRQSARWRRCSSPARASRATSRRCCARRSPTRRQKDGFGGDVDRLYVAACYANQGPSQKRVRPAPMGRAFRVVKRTAHLTVRVAERPAKVGVAAGGETKRPGARRGAPQEGRRGETAREEGDRLAGRWQLVTGD